MNYAALLRKKAEKLETRARAIWVKQDNPSEKAEEQPEEVEKEATAA